MHFINRIGTNAYLLRVDLQRVFLDSRFSQLGQPGNGTISYRTLENQFTF